MNQADITKCKKLKIVYLQDNHKNPNQLVISPEVSSHCPPQQVKVAAISKNM